MSLDWIAHTAQQIAGGPSWSCAAGHEEHAGKRVEVVLDGPHDRIPDFPPIPHHLRCVVPMGIWDWEAALEVRSRDPKPYCPQDDIVSECLETQGVWEGYGTNLLLDILHGSDHGLVVDCGSQIGWYSMISMLRGYPTLSIDADQATLDLLAGSVAEAGVERLWESCRAGLCSDTPVIDRLPDQKVRFMKMDVEGAEDEAVRVFAPLLENQLVDYLMIEVSPCFDDYYPALCLRIAKDYGMVPYAVPEKGTDLDGFGRHPLESMEPLAIPLDSLTDVVASWHQRDVLFARGGIS